VIPHYNILILIRFKYKSIEIIKINDRVCLLQYGSFLRTDRITFSVLGGGGGANPTSAKKF